MRHVTSAALAAALAVAACTPSPGATPGASSSPSSGSPKPAASGSAKPSAAPAASDATMELKRLGEPVAFAGPVAVSLSNSSSILTVSRTSYAGPRDPESTEPFHVMRLIFEKTKGLKPFVLPSVKNSQERRFELDYNGLQYRSSMTGTTDVSDTFAYADGRVKGVWKLQSFAGAPNQPKHDLELTVDFAVPESVR